MKFVYIFLFLFVGLLPTPSLACEIYKELCPQCKPSDLAFYRDGWVEVSSLQSYKDTFSSVSEEVRDALTYCEVPVEYEYLALIESGGKPFNESHKGAAGLWQLMPYISKHYGLTVTSKQDDRLDPVLSTEAAAQYLSKHIDTFDGDIRMVVAAYNAGGSNLLNGVKHKHDFESVRRFYPQAYALSRTVFSVILKDHCPLEPEPSKDLIGEVSDD